MIVLAVLVLIVGGVFLWRYLGSYESTDDAQVDVHLYPVSARISGYVIKVNVNDNQYVQKGDVLVEIDPKDYEVAVEKAQANLASAEATAQSLNITVPITSVSTSSQLSFSASDVRKRQCRNHCGGRATHRRSCPIGTGGGERRESARRPRPLQALVDKQEVSEQIYDQALAAAKASTASVAAAHANEAAAQQAVQQAKSRLAQAEANHRSAETGPQQVASSQARARAAVGRRATKARRTGAG